MEKLNITEILKDCPKGIELYSPIFGEVYLDKIRPHLAIVVTTDKEQGDFKEEFLYDGRYGINGECMLFPSKEKRDWSTFQRPFKDGDVVITKGKNQIFIFKESVKYNGRYYSGICHFGFDLEDGKMFKEGYWSFTRFATEEEKEKLFKAIKDNGYKWNPETKTLEKLIEPKFKVGDKITDKNKFIYRITEITDKGYKLHDLKTTFITFEEADWYFVKVVDIFDIDTLIPFESRVLVRSSMDGLWKPAVFGFRNGYNDNAFYIVGGSCWKQCIPYLNNEHLCGTTNDCDDFYKTWE